MRQSQVLAPYHGTLHLSFPCDSVSRSGTGSIGALWSGTSPLGQRSLARGSSSLHGPSPVGTMSLEAELKAQGLSESMLSIDPAQRPTAEQVRQINEARGGGTRGCLLAQPLPPPLSPLAENSNPSSCF